MTGKSAYFGAFFMQEGRVQFSGIGLVINVGRFRPRTTDRAPMPRHFAKACDLSPIGPPRGHHDALAVGCVRFADEWYLV